MEMTLFFSDGRLDPARFTSMVNQVFELLPDEARELGYDYIGVPHLFVVMTRIEDGCTQDALKRLGHSSEQVRSQLRHDIYQGHALSRKVELLRSRFTGPALHLLEQAARMAIRDSTSQIGERYIVLACLEEEDSRTIGCLKRQGIDVSQMRAILRSMSTDDGESQLAIASHRGERIRSSALSDLPFDPDAQKVLVTSLREAQRKGYDLINTPHLVIALTQVVDGCTCQALEQQGANPNQIRDLIRQAVQPAGPPKTATLDIIRERVASRVQEIIDLATAEAKATGLSAIEERHLLIGFLLVKGSSTATLLQKCGLDLPAMLDFTRGFRSGLHESGSTPLLDKLGRDLTRDAREGKLKPVIGRQREMRRIAQILGRREKNNPLLVGDAGVGKTAIVEGLAQRIISNKVPSHLRDKRVVELPISNLVAGTKFRGDLEQRLMQVLRETSRANIILFLDEIHTLVGAGRAEGGTLDAGNILKPALARGEIRCIGSTTLDEYHKSIEKDTALERRFQTITVEEPSAQETLEILRQTRAHFEAYHQVRILDDALEAAVRLSITYLPNRRLPDKAYDLVDEACVRSRVGSASRWSSQEPLQPASPPSIDADAVAQVVSEWTGVPVTRLTEAEQTRLLRLEELLHRRVIGQDAAISAVSRAIRLARSGLKKPNRPTGVFLFIGPTGVGKTEVAKALAETLLGSEQLLVRLDMSEFMEEHSASKLIGAPPGFIGHDEEGQLTGALRHRPYTVVLLDEIEKAHPRILDLFLQLFDEGRLTDAQGRTCDGRNAIFVMTANMPTTAILKKHALGFGPPAASLATDELSYDITIELRKSFLPEFLNRLDEVVVFQSLNPEQIRTIAQLQLNLLAARLKQQNAITLAVDETALTLICKEGYSEEYGARPLQRVIERKLAEPLSQLILQGVAGNILASVNENQIVLSPQRETGSMSNKDSHPKEAA